MTYSCNAVKAAERGKDQSYGDHQLPLTNPLAVDQAIV